MGAPRARREGPAALGLHSVTAFAVLAWLWALAPVANIPRSIDVAIAISRAAADTNEPKRWAARLDVFAAFETHYGDANVAGGCPGVRSGTPCKREQGAHYCSPFMILCSRIPIGSTLEEEARIAIIIFEESRAVCPSHPLGRFVGVGCRASELAARRQSWIDRETSR